MEENERNAKRRVPGRRAVSRAVVPLLFLLIAVGAAAQTASDLTARYGYPDVERFDVRPENFR